MTCATGEACGEAHATGKCPWVLVEDESELQTGMAVQFRGCSYCRQRETQVLLGSKAASPMTMSSDGVIGPAVSPLTWRISNPCRARDQLPISKMTQMGEMVRERRLYRLALPPLDASATDETQRPDLIERERLKTNAWPRRLTTTNAGGKR